MRARRRPVQRHRGGASPAATRGRRRFRPEHIRRSGTASAGGVLGAHGISRRMRCAGERLQRDVGFTWCRAGTPAGSSHGQ
jgi:hypothetical protein